MAGADSNRARLAGQLGRARTPTAALYGLIFVANLNLTGFFALAPTFADELDLSKVETSLLFTASGIVMALLALPLGLLGDRVGTYRVTVGSTVLLAVSSGLHGLADDLALLLVARVAFGLAFLGVLTAGVAWMAQSTEEENRARAIAGIMPVAGVGALIGPFLAGALTDTAGLGAAYAVLVGFGVLACALVVVAPGSTERQERTPSLASIVRAARVTVVAAAATLMALGVVIDVVVNLLAPLQLDSNGLSAGEIGAIISIGSAVYLAGAIISYRNTGRLVNLRVAGVSAILCAISLVPFLSTSTASQSAGIVVSRLALALLFVVAFPLGALGAHAAGIGLGAANGLLMLALGVANTVAPIGSAAVASALDDRWVYVGLAVVAVAAGSWMIRASRTHEPRPVVRQAVPPTG